MLHGNIQLGRLGRYWLYDDTPQFFYIHNAFSIHIQTLMSVRESMNVISTQSVVILMAHTHVPAILGIMALGESVVSLSLHFMSTCTTASLSYKDLLLVQHADRKQSFINSM